jgi:dTDP-4-amino-4,6-dideoxygalactose transaminase
MKPLLDKPFIVFGKPSIGEAEKDAVREVLESGWLSTGSKVKEFETEFEGHMGGGFAVAVSSCTEALTISLLACGVEPGDEVITTPLTFVATVNAILALGAKPVFVDVRPDGQIDPEKIERAITKRTLAIVPVHYTGAPAPLRELRSIALTAGLKIVEDAAHGFGGHHMGSQSVPVGGTKGFYVEQNPKIGTLGDFSCFSFYPTKNITSGEGGMVFTHDPQMAALVRTISQQGLSSGAHKRYGATEPMPYRAVLPGRKANMSDVHAAIGLAQIRRWPELKAQRAVVWSGYEAAFGGKEQGHSQHLFTLTNPRRDEMRRRLFEKGIGTGIHFSPVHLEPGFSFLGHKSGSFPQAEAIGHTTYSLPVSATMTTEDADRVVEAVFEANKRGVGKWEI